jgi:transcriptional regulator with GAF, ATPase, and Fis domain
VSQIVDFINFINKRTPLSVAFYLQAVHRFQNNGYSTALERAENNLTATARDLGTTRETLRYRVKKISIKNY